MNSKEKVLNVVKKHNLMYVGTVDDRGMPKVRSVVYAMGDDESILYFLTNKFTDKVKEIKNNNNVYIVIDHDCHSMEALQKLVFIKATAKANIIENAEEMQKALQAITKKFPFMKDLPGDPNDYVGIRIELETVKLTDNSVSFGHTEDINYRG